MNHMITEVVGSTYFVNEVATSQSIRKEKGFTENYTNRIAQISRVHKVKEVASLKAQDKHTKAQEFFKAELITNEEGEHSIIMVSNHQRVRQINLDGMSSKETERMINPVKVKAAYFKDE